MEWLKISQAELEYLVNRCAQQCFQCIVIHRPLATWLTQEHTRPSTEQHRLPKSISFQSIPLRMPWMWFARLCGSYDKYDCIMVIDLNAEPSLVLLANHKPNQSFFHHCPRSHVFITMPRLHLILSILVSEFVRICNIICHVKNIHLATEERNITVVFNDCSSNHHLNSW